MAGACLTCDAALWWVLLGGVVVVALVGLCLPEPPVASRMTSTTITSTIAPTAIVYPREGPLGCERPRPRLRLRCEGETIGSSIPSDGRSWLRRYSSTSALPSRSSAVA